MYTRTHNKQTNKRGFYTEIQESKTKVTLSADNDDIQTGGKKELSTGDVCGLRRLRRCSDYVMDFLCNLLCLSNHACILGTLLSRFRYPTCGPTVTNWKNYFTMGTLEPSLVPG